MACDHWYALFLIWHVTTAFAGGQVHWCSVHRAYPESVRFHRIALHFYFDLNLTPCAGHLLCQQQQLDHTHFGAAIKQLHRLQHRQNVLLQS